MLGRIGSEGVREGFREQSGVTCRAVCERVSRIDTQGTDQPLPGLFAGFVLIILSGFLRIWGQRTSEICRLVPLHNVHYLNV